VTTKATGTGLGLTVSRQIVQAHGGRIVALSHPDGGALVEVYIPQAPNGAG
jgi:two-component system phosphate regulon sensor histidine kinase PhoR